MVVFNSYGFIGRYFCSVRGRGVYIYTPTKHKAANSHEPLVIDFEGEKHPGKVFGCNL